MWQLMLYPSLDKWIHTELTTNNTMNDAVSTLQDESTQLLVKYCARSVEQVWWSASVTECMEKKTPNNNKSIAKNAFAPRFLFHSGSALMDTAVYYRTKTNMSRSKLCNV